MYYCNIKKVTRLFAGDHIFSTVDIYLVYIGMGLRALFFYWVSCDLTAGVAIVINDFEKTVLSCMYD